MLFYLKYRDYLFVFLSLIVSSSLYGQPTDSIVVLGDVVVSGIRTSTVKETSLNIWSLSLQKMRQSGSFNISDGLAKLPGISQLNTGVAISKPVIRGLYGNRVLAVISGLKFDNQQWQDEHGLGLSDMGIDRIEVIKGPASLLYGSEAIGGILNVIEEAPAKPGAKSGDINVGMTSNTLGISLDGGFKGATAKKNWGIRFGIDSHADYSDGNNHRILNSRFTGYHLKGSLGFNKKNWTNRNLFSSSFDNFGFITADNQNDKSVDGRLSRSMDGPHHSVLLNILTSQNSIQLPASALDVNVGLQSNLRLEDEGGGQISLNMLLSTLLWRVSWNKQLNAATELNLSNNSQFENNTNFGSRIIIPDANMMETGFAGFIRNKKKKLILELGTGISLRNIHTKLTPGVNTPDKAIPPFNKTLPSINGSVGFSWNPDQYWNIKSNVSTGFRSGNLAELSSDGLHEGTLRYETGDANMKVEQNINSEISFSYTSLPIQFSVSGFINHFLNYIYLAPTGIQYLGFDVFHYKQYDANLYGSEMMLGFYLPFYTKLKFESDFSTVTGKLSNGTYLPFIPPAKWTNELKLKCPDGKRIKDAIAFVQAENHFSQNHPAEFETSTSGYWLLNAGFSATWQTKKREIVLSITGNNILNKNYYDHLSRFKDYGIHNIGTNIVVHMNIPLIIHSKKIKK